MVSHLHPGQIQTLADVGSAGGVHYHCPEAGRNTGFQFVNGQNLGAVFITPGEMANQITQRVNIQGSKLLCLGRTDAFEQGDGICEPCHLLHLLFLGFLLNEGFNFLC